MTKYLLHVEDDDQKARVIAKLCKKQCEAMHVELTRVLSLHEAVSALIAPIELVPIEAEIVGVISDWDFPVVWGQRTTSNAGQSLIALTHALELPTLIVSGGDLLAIAKVVRALRSTATVAYPSDWKGNIEGFLREVDGRSSAALRPLTRQVRYIAGELKALSGAGLSAMARELVEPLRVVLAARGLGPSCHAERSGNPNLTSEQTVEWYAGQLLDIVDAEAWSAMNATLNCLDKFVPEAPIPDLKPVNG